MTIQTCLNSAAAQGQITPAERDAMTRLYNSLLAHYGDVTVARAEMVERLMRQAQQERRVGLLSEDARQRVEAYMLNYRNVRGETDPAQALVYLMEHNGQVRMPEGMSSVAGRFKSIFGLAQANMEELIHEFRRTMVTGQTRSAAGLENVLREARGENTGDAAARALAHAWMDTANMLRERFNAAGGAVAYLAHWGVSQVHDARALLNRGMQAWIDDITPRLDLANMRHPLTGGTMTPADLRQSLEHIYRTITTNGWADRDPGGQRGGLGMLANQRSEARFLLFRSADDWLAYNRDYGGGADVFVAMMNHLSGMAQDIAAMEILGPNPSAMVEYLSQFVERQAHLAAAGDGSAVFATRTPMLGRRIVRDGNYLTTKGAVDYGRGQINLAQGMWELYRGGAGAVVNQRVADTFGTMRSLNVAAKLGGATLSAMTDQGHQQMARYFAGIPLMTQQAEFLRAFATPTKREAVQAGLILDTASHRLTQEARYSGGMDGHQVSKVLADRVVAASGLQAWTQAGKHAFGLAIMAELKNRADQALGDLNPRLQRTFERYGITAADWDLIRATQGHDHFLRPTDVFETHRYGDNARRNLGERYLEMIFGESEYSTPEGTLQMKARAYSGLQKGTLRDEAVRSWGQFKMFGMSVAMLQGQRIAQQAINDGVFRGAGYAATLLITTALWGALAMQLKNIAAGKDPLPATDERYRTKFWLAALAQGGGAGIWGDLLFSEQTRTGGNAMKTFIGPTGDVAASALALTSGNMAQLMRGEKTHLGREAVRFIGSNIPGSSLWYTRAAFEHMVLDRLHKAADPEAYDAFRRRIVKQRSDFGNDFWWRPGETTPDRPPQFSR
jgi:hypothetical protein